MEAETSAMLPALQYLVRISEVPNGSSDETFKICLESGALNPPLPNTFKNDISRIILKTAFVSFQYL